MSGRLIVEKLIFYRKEYFDLVAVKIFLIKNKNEKQNVICQRKKEISKFKLLNELKFANRMSIIHACYVIKVIIYKSEYYHDL